MKTFINKLRLLVLAIMTMVGVSAFGQASGEYLAVSTNGIRFAISGGIQHFEIASNTEWSISVSGGNDWLTVSPMSGQGYKEITVSSKENTSAPRTATIIVKWNDGETEYMETITVYQAYVPTPDPPSLPSSITFSSQGGSQTFTLTSNVAWTISSSSGWLSASPSSGSGDAEVTVHVTENSSNYDRTAVLTITTAGGYTRTIHIKQGGQGSYLYMKVSMINMAFAPAGGTLSFNISSNIDWQISIPEEADWLTVNPDHGSGDGTVAVTAAPNATAQSRTARIIISGGDLTQTVTVNAFAPDGITATTADTPQKQLQIFNLQGQKMNHRTMPHGIYIINGKKVLK